MLRIDETNCLVFVSFFKICTLIARRKNLNDEGINLNLKVFSHSITIPKYNVNILIYFISNAIPKTIIINAFN